MLVKIVPFCQCEGGQIASTDDTFYLRETSSVIAHAKTSQPFEFYPWHNSYLNKDLSLVVILFIDSVYKAKIQYQTEPKQSTVQYTTTFTLYMNGFIDWILIYAVFTIQRKNFQ